MFNRNLYQELTDTAKQYPVIGLVGPRQSGKTTLVKQVFHNKPYANLEKPDIRLLAEEDPERFLAKYPDGVILDEIQRAPKLLSYIQVIVDEKKQNGQFIITGSHQLELHEAISQSLAGRIGLLHLYPLTLDELKAANIELSLHSQILHGFFPRIYQENLNPTKAYRNYLHTYIEKDVRLISEIKNLTQFHIFLKLCAGRIGQILDYASLSNEVGVSAATIKHWLSVLEASYLVFRLVPYYENFGKRIIKAPKLYFTDVGLAAYLLDLEKISQVERDPLRGNLVENLAVVELLKYRTNLGLDPNIYYFRDSNHNEVDVVIREGNQLIPVEIKSSQTYNRSFLKGIHYFKQLVKERCSRSYLIYAGDTEQEIQQTMLLNYKHIKQVYEDGEEML